MSSLSVADWHHLLFSLPNKPHGSSKFHHHRSWFHQPFLDAAKPSIFLSTNRWIDGEKMWHLNCQDCYSFGSCLANIVPSNSLAIIERCLSGSLISLNSVFNLPNKITLDLDQTRISLTPCYPCTCRFNNTLRQHTSPWTNKSKKLDSYQTCLKETGTTKCVSRIPKGSSKAVFMKDSKDFPLTFSQTRPKKSVQKLYV